MGAADLDEIPQHRLRLWPDGDAAVAPAVRRLVPGRPVEPHSTLALQVARARRQHLAGAHAGQQLQAHHRGDVRPDQRQDRLDVRQRRRPHLLRLAGLGAAGLQRPHRGQGVQDAGGDQFLLDGPAHHAHDAGDTGVDLLAAQGRLRAVLGVVVAAHHQGADRLEALGPQPPRRQRGVQVCEGTEGVAVVLQLPRRLAVVGVAVVELGVLPEGQHQVGHGDAAGNLVRIAPREAQPLAVLLGGQRLAVVGQPL
jgi:hypothetical protein